MKTIAALSTTAVVLAALALPASAAPVSSIQDYGMDGDSHFYQVRCEDGRSGSLEVRSRPPEVCVVPQVGESVCREGWRIEEAAEHACR